MRLYLLPLLVFFLSIPSLFAQAPYNPFAVDNTHWGMIYKPPLTIPPYEDIFEFHTRGDTVIGAYTYQKVYYQDMRSKNLDYDPPWVPVDIPHLMALIRDDTIARKVYAIQLDSARWACECPQGKEFLLYDFSLEVGDSVNLCIEGGADTVSGVFYAPLYREPGANIDSVKYIQFSYDLAWDIGTISEVWGSERGPFIQKLTSVSSPHRGYYFCRTSGAPFCNIPGLAIEKYLSSHVWEMGPNPSRDHIWVRWKGVGLDLPNQVVLYDLQRRPVFNTFWTGAEPLEVDMRPFTEGVYMIAVYSDDAFWGYQKVVVVR